MPGVVLTGAALAALIAQCAGPSPPTDLLTRIVMHESQGHADVTNTNYAKNKDGSWQLDTSGRRVVASIDYGLAQINSSNLAWLGETPTTILDPCHNLAAEARILRGFSGYATGSTERGFVLRPPGQQVSYVESMSDPKYRDRSAVAPSPHRQVAMLLSVHTNRR